MMQALNSPALKCYMESSLGMPLSCAQILFADEQAAAHWQAGGGEARITAQGIDGELDIKLVAANGTVLQAFQCGDEVKVFV